MDLKAWAVSSAWLERNVDIVEVTGSTPVPPIVIEVQGSLRKRNNWVEETSFVGYNEALRASRLTPGIVYDSCTAHCN